MYCAAYLKNSLNNDCCYPVYLDNAKLIAVNTKCRILNRTCHMGYNTRMLKFVFFKIAIKNYTTVCLTLTLKWVFF